MLRIVLIVLLVAVMCDRSFGGESVAPLNDSLYLSAPVVIDNVTVWPVYSRKPPQAVGDYTTLDQAQKQNLAFVRETGATAQANAAANGAVAPAAAQPAVQVAPPIQNRAVEPQQIGQQQERAQQQAIQQLQGEIEGEVNQLVIENKGEKAILVLAGTIVKGGKQDRQIAQDFIIPPGQTMPVAAFCIEHGRWTGSREGAQTNGHFQAQGVLANKEVRDKAQFKNSQQEVWDNVSTANLANSKSPKTGTLLATVEETDKDALARRERIKKAVGDKLNELSQSADAPVGLAYAVDGKIREIRSFAHPKILGQYRETLLNTIAIEGDQAQRKAIVQKKDVFKQAASHQQCVELVANAEKLKEEQQKFQGNHNGYRKDGKVWNANLYSKEAGKPAPSATPLSQAFTPAE